MLQQKFHHCRKTIPCRDAQRRGPANVRHVSPGIDLGALGQEHYDNYIKLREESAFYQMTDVEKRKKDRDFGKFIKSAKKDLDN